MSVVPQLLNSDTEVEPLIEKPLQRQKPGGKPEVLIVSKVKAWMPGTDKILAGLYLVFLAWQTAVLVPYTIHTLYCVFNHEQLGFKCKSSPIPHALELEFAMYVSMVLHQVTFLWLLRKIPHFLGYKAIFAKFARLSKFWSLAFLLLLQFIGLLIIQFKSESSFLLAALITVFVCYGVSVLALVGVLNYTQGEFIKQKYPYYKFVFFKLTIAVVLAETFVLFLLGTVETAAGVTGLGREVPQSALGKTSFETLRQFADGVLFYKISDFLWQKLFTDNRNILFQYDYL